MDVPSALALVAVLLLAASAVGALARRRAGRARRARLTGEIDLRELGISDTADVATIVQFSTEYCARCPGVRRALTSIAADESGVSVDEVDLTHRPDLASRFRILQTPTVLVIAPSRSEIARFAGDVRPEAIRRLLSTLKGTPDGLVA